MTDRRLSKKRTAAALTIGAILVSVSAVGGGIYSWAANKGSTVRQPDRHLAAAGGHAKASDPAKSPSKGAAKAAPPAKHVPGKTLDSLVNGWLKRPDLQHSQIGIEVMELKSKRVLYSLNGNRRFTTASTAKVLTTACAFDTLGPNYLYKTELVATGPVDQGKVKGNIVIVPSQDPTFTRSDLQQMFSQLLAKKIKQVEGTFEIAAVPGGHDHFFSGWLPEDWGQTWMPVSSNLVIDRNIAPGAVPFRGAKIVQVQPDGHHNALLAGLMNSDEAAAWVNYYPARKELRVCAGRGTTIKSPLAVANPDEYNVALAQSMLQDMGIRLQTSPVKQVIGFVKQQMKPRNQENEEPGVILNERGELVIAEHLSKPLSSIIQTTLHESDNLYAQQILRTLGLLSKEEASKLSPAKIKDMALIEDRGLYRLTNWLGKIGCPTQEVLLFDGCGLSRKNCVSPHALNCVLDHMATPTMNGPYLSLLKTTGGGAGGRGIYHYKTGSMDSVSSIAGILDTAGGQNLAVTIIVNGHTPSIRRVRGEETELVSFLGTIKSVSGTIEQSKTQAAELNSAEPVEITTAPLPARTRHGARSTRRRRHR